MEKKLTLRNIKVPVDFTSSDGLKIAHMPLTDTHRGNRVQFMEKILKEEGYEPVHFVVHNYQAAQAKRLLNTHPDALAYLCLSDPIAVSLKHLLEVKGEVVKHRILGFDDSELALKEHLSSFGQYLRAARGRPSLGALAVQELLRGISGRLRSSQSIEIPVYLALRG